MKTLALVALLLLISLRLPQAQAAVDSDLQTWVSFMVQGPMSGKLRGYLEVQPRFGMDQTHVDRIIIRPAVYYQLTDEFSFWVGHAWQPIFQPGFVNEHRSWQQAQHNSEIDRFQLTHRLRLEERFISTVSTGPAWRFRYSLRTLYALNNDKTWKALLQNEVFLNLNSVPPGPMSGFDQYRLFAGIHHKFGSSFSMEAAYLMNYVSRPLATADRINHALVLNQYFYF